MPRRSWLLGGGVGKEPSTGPFMAFTRKGCCRQENGRKDRKSKVEWQRHPTPPQLAGALPLPWHGTATTVPSRK